MSFDPEKIVPGTDIRYGDLKYGGKCQNERPAIVIKRQLIVYERDNVWERDGEIYAEHVPESRIDEISGVFIDCLAYQALIAAGVRVEDCATCPLRVAPES